MNHNEYAIRTDNLFKSYKSTNALTDLCLEVPKGSIFGFLGPNGAGKTTTMKILLGLITPSSGNGKIFGLDIEKDSISIRSRTGYLSQNPRFYERFSARENLRFVAGFFYKGLKSDLDRLVNEALSIVGLEGKADRPIKGFSGGEIQRLGIAQAQLNNPDLLILDEPMASLDPVGRKEILDVMDSLKGRTTVFYSTHILSDVQRVSDTVAILNHGKLVASGNIKDILSSGKSVIYEAFLKAGLEKAKSILAAHQWVTNVEAHDQDERTLLSIHVSDPDIAEAKLLKLLYSDEDIIVTEFKKKEYGLEDAFMEVIGRGDKNDC